MKKSNRYIGIERLLTNPIKLAEGNAPDEIQILPVGSWNHPYYGKLSISETNLDEYKQHFDAHVRRDIPITAGHDNGMSGGELPAVGWFKQLVNKGSDGLWATIEWTEQGKELLAQKAFKYFSPEYADKYEDPETRKKYSNVLVGGALTNKPYFKELYPVVQGSEPSDDLPVFVLSENIISKPSDDMLKLEDIVKKAASELTAEEKTFMREHKGELSADDQKKFSEALGDEGGDEKDEDTEEDTPETKEAREPQPGMKTMSEAEYRALVDKANKGADAERQVREMKFTSEVQTLIFSETNKTGKLAPKSKDKVVAFMMSLNESQLKSFREIVKELPEATTFKEIGDGNDSEPDTAKEFDDAVQAKIKASEGKMSYSEAVNAVARDNPALVQKYNEAVQPA